ncbi:MAG TPA: exosortase V [Sphingomicrobium sp.]|nr:exosortase V [Sphingomicrobium sp.]
MLLVKTQPPSTIDRLRWPLLVFLAGIAAILAPTMYDVARLTWTTEQGGHAPIIVATGAWLLFRELQSTKVKARPGKLWIGTLALATTLIGYAVARITGILELEGLAMYAAVLSAFYLLIGGALLRALWFPLVYLAAALPPPDTVVSVITQPIKIGISEAAVSLLHSLGYPIASSGVTIQIANYELLVAAACAGLNSIITLSAICLFYVYLRHRSDLASFLIVGALIVPVAVFSNFMRVVILVLVTYYLGEAAAQGFLHDFAGLTVFLVALLSIIGLDSLFSRIRERRKAAAA